MKRKFLAALLALVMVFSMIPVSASAAGNVTVTGDDPITDNNRSVSFHLYTTQLYKLIMLEDNSATADSDVSGVSLLLYDGFGVLDRTELSLRKIGVTKAETDYFEYSNTNRGHALEPDNIKGLKISYSTGDSQKEIAIDASDLLLHCERGALNLTADYTIMSSNTDKSIVAFYDNGGNAQGVNYSLYDAYLIPRNTTMQSHGIWPETPSYIAYHFVNWDLNKAGGSPFLQTSVVDGDKEVFSQKSALGDETIGTEIHVINTQNELKTRFVELYNAANDSAITVDDINWDTIKVSVADTDGKETNPNYNTGALPNEWREYQGETYYWVQNFDADLPGLEDTSYYNEHIAFDKITSMTVSADVNGKTYTYTIYKGSDKGDFAVSQLAGNTHIIEIHILAKPEKPDSDDLIGTVELPGILANGTVAIDCTTNNNHSTKTYGLKEGTYSVSDVKWSGSSSDGYYYADVTITDFGPYVTEYGDGHTPAENQGNDTTITVMYDNTAGAWTVPTNEIPVTYNVVCTTEPGGGDEPTPTPTPNPGPDPDPDPDPDPTPTPTPTPDPGDDNNPPYNPPYIPPVDPDDSGVSELLNTDDHIQYLFGYPEGTFGPENNMTRAEVAQMFYNLLLDQDVTITKTFDDVPANAWYAKAVNTLASLGVVSGVGNGDFEPERSITRAEFTSIAMKFAEGKTGGTNIFSDVKSTDWFYRAVVNSTQYGWIHGYGDGTFRPNNPITRVEVTAIVNNMLGREADVDFVTEHYDELNHFSDLAVSHWGYYHIVEATNDHDYTKPSSGENWTELN